MSRDEPAPIHFDLFPLPEGRLAINYRDLPTLETGEPFLMLERQITGSMFGLQPIVQGPLDGIRAYCASILSQQTGINTGFGWMQWNDHSLTEWFRMPEDKWIFMPKQLLWEIQLGFSMWIAAFVGAPLDSVVEWHKDFLQRARDEQVQGDFSRMSNNAQQSNIPSIDALVHFFRDTLLNRLLELVPKLQNKAFDAFDRDAIDLVRQWVLPPKTLWPYIVKANEMKARDVFSQLRRIQEATRSTTLRAGLLYREAEESTHLECIETVKLPGYYMQVDFVPPADSLVNFESTTMYWPSTIEGPVNMKRAETMTDFLSTYLHHAHIVMCESDHVGFLQVLIAQPSVGQRRQKIQNQINDLRREARDSLYQMIERLEPSKIQQTQHKSIVAAWFSDLE